MRILLGVILFVALVSTATWFCARDGILLETFASTDKDEPTRKTLLDAYNSYSDLLASILIKPVDLFLAVVLTVGFLCFATKSSVGEQSARFQMIALVTTVGAGYLLTNGFSAINVQLAPRSVDFVITARDLSESALDDAFAAANEDAESPFMAYERTFNKSLLETETKKNPISNTALRGSILSMEITPKNRCTAFQETNPVVPSYGFPQRTWQKFVLQEAIEPIKSLAISLDNSTDVVHVLSSAGVETGGTELPMEVDQAIKLVIHSMVASYKVELYSVCGCGRIYS